MVRQKQALTLQINLLMGRRHFDIVSPTNLSVVSLYLEHKNRKKELILNKVSPEEAILKIPEERQSRIKLFNTKTSLINPASNNMSKKKLIIPSIPLANVLIFILLGFVAATEDEQKEFYIVYLGDQPVDNVSAVQTHMDVLLSIKRSDVEARESIIYSYTKIFNAFAAKLSKAEASKLSRREEVLSVFPNRYHKLHTTKSWDFIGLPNTAKRNLKMERNIVVGLLDTGITPQSESFKDDGFGPPPKKWIGTCGHYTNFSGCNNKLVGARYFKLDGNPDPSDILSPVDVDGHGTHTSSTLAGNLIPDASLFGLAGGAARGAVPNARVAMYKVCWVSSGCSDMDLLAAFEAAIHDGVDVLSISIGGVDANYVSDGLAIGAFHAMKKGIITVASGGNDGPSSGSVANHAPWILTVAASGINREFRSKVELGNGKIFSGVGVNKFEPKEKSYPLVSGAEAGYYGRQDSARFCDAGSLDPNKVKGKLVLCELGEWGADSVVKGIGGKGIILESQQYLDAAQIFMAPATMVNATVSDAVYDYIHSTKFPSAMIHRSQEVEVPAPFVASFSSRDSGVSAVPLKWKGKCESGTKFSPSNCNKKLIGARAFFKGYESVAGRINETIDYRSPRDSQGHGTHTAATAAGNLVDKASFYGLANGSAAGMKYTARIAVYKVCWTSGCASSDLLAAIDQAVADGVDVLSLSLGGFAKPFYSDSIAIASFGAIQKGVFVSCSAGNLGPSISSVDNNAPWIMTVAASYTDRRFPTTVKLGKGQTFEGASLYTGKATAQLPLVHAGTAGGEGAEYCIIGSLKKKLVKGKMVVCMRGMNGRAQKGEQVKLAGGKGMLLINTETGGEELFADAHVLPATSLGASAGIAVKEYMNSTKRATASIAFKGTVYGDPAPMLAAFSSRGPSSVGPDVIKPDVTAPGVNILAAWPPMTSPTLLESDKRSVLFNVISGTSMSCPHVSGLAALLKSVHKKWSPAAIKSALMTTAYATDNRGSPIADVGSSNSASATPFAFGSGHVDPERASDPGLIYDITIEDYLNYFCSLNYTSSQIAQVSRRNVTCPDNKALQPGDLNYPSFAVNFEGNARNNRVKYKRTLTNVGTPSSTYAVKVEEPNGVSVILEPKSLSFEKLGQKLSYNVTFVSSGGKGREGSSSFGSLVWLSGKYSVRSPIAVTWQ
ncbi:hypothetical protein NC652_032754 [Populus alba x Populus x berolinensis]|nr:hypothetical protein NC652_032754 [Populus alba x Populus x berolinensis]